MHSYRLTENWNELVVTMLAKPFDRAKGDHLRSCVVVSHLVDQIHQDPENMERVGRCPSEKVHVEVTGNIATSLGIKPSSRIVHCFL